MTATPTATVELLTAEVRVLMIGRRQVTLSVYRQLDTIDPDQIEPFGRVRDGKDTDRKRLTAQSAVYDPKDPWGRDGVHVVGVGETGELVRSSAWDLRVRTGAPAYPWHTDGRAAWRDEWVERDPYHATWSALPLIVLAGLR